MREYPWHARPVLAVHLRFFDAIVARNQLIQRWLSVASLPASALERGAVDPALQEAFVWLDRLPKGTTESETEKLAWFEEWAESTIGSRTPEEALEELFCAVRVREAQVVEHVHQKHPDRLALLRDAAREAGGEYGSKEPFYSEQRDPSVAFSQLLQLPFQWLNQPSKDCCICERSSSGRLDWIHVECPHQDLLLERGPVADLLCEMHECWVSGFFSALYPSSKLDRLKPDPLKNYCRFRLEMK